MTGIGIGIWLYILGRTFTSPKSTSLKILKEWYNIKLTLDIIFFLALVIRFLLFQPFYVSGASMEPNLHDGNLLVIEKLSYYFYQPQRGDIVVFRYPEDPTKIYIKRIIGLPGEKIVIKEGKVKIYNTKNIQGVELQEPYVKQNTTTLGIVDYLLGEGEYFVLGDNRDPNASSDSREWGPLKEKYIMGKAWIRIWPPGQFSILQKPEYNLLTHLLKQLAKIKIINSKYDQVELVIF